MLFLKTTMADVTIEAFEIPELKATKRSSTKDNVIDIHPSLLQKSPKLAKYGKVYPPRPDITGEMLMDNTVHHTSLYHL